MSAPFLGRERHLRTLLKSQGLDIIILYAARFDCRFVKWATGISCNSAFHYFFVTENRMGFLEISYRVAELQAKTSIEVISIPEENEARRVLANFLSDYKAIGIAGAAPLSHLFDVAEHCKDITEILEPKLVIKDKSEISQIASLAASLNDLISESGSGVRKGASEDEISQSIRRKASGVSDRVAISPTVLSGTRLKASTVGTASSRILEEGDAVLIDLGIVKNEFYTDCTRMFFVGESPAKIHYEKLVDAHHAAIKQIRAEMNCKDVLRIYRDSLGQRDLPSDTLTLQDLGHGIGYGLHEEPFIYTEKNADMKITEGMIFTLEPEISFSNYMLRVEDMVAVTNGKLEVLTK